MSNLKRQQTILTSHGHLAVEESGEGRVPLVMIHGNSFCRGVFRHQLEGAFAANHRIITFDLPGHGESSDSSTPLPTYTRVGLAEAVIEFLDKLGVEEAVVLGWSLGGHVAMEMAPRFSGMRGLMIVGAPPVGPKTMRLGFNASPQMGLAGKEDLSQAEIEAFVHGIFGNSAEPFLFDAISRTDRRVRKRLFEALRAEAQDTEAGPDVHEVIGTMRIPMAVVNGAEDSIVNLDYFDTVSYGNLWEGKCHRIANAGHAPFWQTPAAFNPILERFLYTLGT
jgi:pimeloyl-ACP methyl ester carboxylesterase